MSLTRAPAVVKRWISASLRVRDPFGETSRDIITSSQCRVGRRGGLGHGGAALGYQKARDLVWATGIAFLLNDPATTLELGLSAIRGLQQGSDRLRMGITLHMIAGTLAASRPDAAAIILGAAEAHVIESARTAQPINSTVAAALGAERTRELRARGAGMDWDQAVAYTLTQTAQALAELQSETRS